MYFSTKVIQTLKVFKYLNNSKRFNELLERDLILKDDCFVALETIGCYEKVEAMRINLALFTIVLMIFE